MNEKTPNTWYEVDYYEPDYGWCRFGMRYGSPQEAIDAWPMCYEDGELRIFQVVTTESEVVD